MQIKTHRRKNPYSDREKCEICDRSPASYWSQATGPGYERLSREVFHCQVHRQGARQIVAELVASARPA